MSAASPRIHPTAIIEPGAEIHESVRIGPYAVLGDQVRLAAGVELAAHAVLSGRTWIGACSFIGSFAVLGGRAQIQGPHQEHGRVELGERVEVRSHVTIHAGTSGEDPCTRVGAGTLLMTGAHVAHDCRIGPRCVLASNSALGGHVQLGLGVGIGGNAAVHQFVRMGDGSFLGGVSGLRRDLIPWGLAHGSYASLRGLNLRALRREGHSRESIRAAQGCCDALFAGGELPLRERVELAAAEESLDPLVASILDFLRAPSRRRCCLPRSRD